MRAKRRVNRLLSTRCVCITPHSLAAYTGQAALADSQTFAEHRELSVGALAEKARMRNAQPGQQFSSASMSKPPDPRPRLGSATRRSQLVGGRVAYCELDTAGMKEAIGDHTPVIHDEVLSRFATRARSPILVPV